MKRLISIILALLMLFTANGIAETTNQPASGLVALPETVVHDYFLDVLLRVDQPDDSILEMPVRIKAFRVTYQYNVLRDAQTNRLAGFNYDSATLIKPEVLSFNQTDSPSFNQFLLDCIDLQFSNIIPPEHFELEQMSSSDFCLVNVTGGQFDVTYNGTLFFSSSNGQLINTEEKTLTLDCTFSNGEE